PAREGERDRELCTGRIRRDAEACELDCRTSRTRRLFVRRRFRARRVCFAELDRPSLVEEMMIRPFSSEHEDAITNGNVGDGGSDARLGPGAVGMKLGPAVGFRLELPQIAQNVPIRSADHHDAIACSVENSTPTGTSTWPSRSGMQFVPLDALGFGFEDPRVAE